MIETKFKDTEIGKIPEKWGVKDLRSFLSLLTDYDANGSFADMASNVKTTDGYGYAWYVRATDLEQNTKLSKVKYTDESSYNFLKKSSLHGGEVLVAKRGEIGKVYYFEMKTQKATLAPNLYLLKLNNNIYPYYLFLYLKYGLGNKLLKSINASTSLGAIYKEDVKDIKVIVPTVSEQRRIATALSNVDALISAVEKKIEKKKLIKQGAMQQLLTGKKRLNGYKGEWVEKRLGEGLSFQPGYPFASKYFNNSIGIRLIKNRDLKADDTIVYYQGDCPKEFLVQDGDLLVGMDGDFLPCLWNKGPALLNQRVGRLNIIGKWDRKFLYYYLYEPLLKMQEGTGATTVKHLSHTDIEKIILPIPDPSEQRAIASVLSNMDSEITALEHKRDKLKEVKQGMMQQLLTGKIRLV